MTTPEFPNPEDGRLEVMSSLWGRDRPVDSGGDPLMGPGCTLPTGGEPLATLPVPEVVTMGSCSIPAHHHGPLVTLHPAECLGAELGLLVRVTQDKAQALAYDACELAEVPQVPVECVSAPNRKFWNAGGWFCGDAAFPLFRYPARIVLNRAYGGNNLRTLAHELAHHVVVVRRIRAWGAGSARRIRPHAYPFPATFREMVRHVHTLVAP